MASRSARKRPLAGRVAAFDGKPRRILGYARVSSEGQTKGTSLDDQQRAIRAYAESIGVPVARMFVEAETGVLDTREQVRALLAEVRPGDLVVAHRLDRWGRDPAFLYSSVRRLVDAGADFYLIAEACGPRDDNWDTVFGIHALVAKLEHKRIKERLIGTRSALIDQGYFAVGVVPTGYRRRREDELRPGEERKRLNILTIVEDDAAMVRTAFRLCAAGTAIDAIAAKVGRKRALVAYVLRSRVYLGEMLNSRGEWIKGLHEPIVDADLFARAQAALDARRHGGPRPRKHRGATAGWVLRDVARCALCGARMSSAYSNHRPDGSYENFYYHCANAKISHGKKRKCPARVVRVDAVEAAADPLVLARLEELRDELAAEPKRAKRSTVDEQAIAAKRTALARKRERYVEAFADDALTREELRERMRKLDDESTRLDGQEAAAKKPSPLDDPAQRRVVLRTVQGLRKAWAKATPVERREIVGLLAHEVRLALGRPPEPRWRSAEELAEPC